MFETYLIFHLLTGLVTSVNVMECGAKPLSSNFQLTQTISPLGVGLLGPAGVPMAISICNPDAAPVTFPSPTYVPGH